MTESNSERPDHFAAPERTASRQLSRIVFVVLLVAGTQPGTQPGSIFPPGVAFADEQSPRVVHDSGEGGQQQAQSCIPSGDHTSIQQALTGEGSQAVLCPDALFELSETIFFTADGQSIYTQGLPTDSTRALLKVVGQNVVTAVSAEGNDYVSIRHVIIDGNRPELGFGDGALINFGRGILDQDAIGHVVEWVKAYEPRGWTVIYIGGPCTLAMVRNNEVGPAGRSEYIIADGISLDCSNSAVIDNTIVDATDGGIVIFQSPGSLIANNIIRAENRVMFYGISMEDYWPTDGDFTGTRVTDNVIDAAGAMIREGIGMGPYVGCSGEGDDLRSRGAIVTGNILRGEHMAYGFVVGGVEDWTVTGNVDSSTHLIPELEGDCQGSVVDPPAGFQYNPLTSSGTFQPEFEAAVMTATLQMWPSLALMSESCLSDLIGAALLEDIKAGNQGSLWEALEAAPNGARIAQCMSIYEPPDVSGLPGNVGVEVQPCVPFCARLRMFNLSDDTADLRGAKFLLDAFSVQCVGLPDSLGPWEETSCVIEDFVTEGFQVLRWYGFQPDGGMWGFGYPFEGSAVAEDETQSQAPVPLLLLQNYPNPYNASTVMDYTVPEGARARVHIEIYDLQGRLIRSLVDADQPPGRYTVGWDGRDNQGKELSSGVYFFRIEAGDLRSSRKTMLLR